MHDRFDARVNVFRVAPLAQKAQAQRRIGVDGLSFDEGLERSLPAEETCQMPRAEHDAKAAAGKGESCGRRADAIVAGRDEIGAGTERRPADGDNRERRRAANRFEQRLDRLEPRAKLGGMR